MFSYISSVISKGYNYVADLFDSGEELMTSFYDDETVGLTACTPEAERPQAPENAGVHLAIPEAAADNWSAAADYVLRWFCGVTEPTNHDILNAGSALRQANEQHIANDPDLFDNECFSPVECDHRIFRIFDGGYVEIFIPTPTTEDICLQPAIPLVAPPVEQPDAGTPVLETTDAGTNGDIEADAEVIDPPAPTPVHRPNGRPHPRPTNTPSTPTKPPTTTQPVVPLP